MVARTYEKYEIIGEPFTKNKRKYVIVKTPKGEKEVRWYSEKEYYNMYPDAERVKNTCDYRKVLGFGDAGYITIYNGCNSFDDEWWFKQEPACRYHKIWGWYTPSDEKVPTELPEGITTQKLYWTNVCTPQGTVTDASAQSGYDIIVFGKTVGKFIGNIGERIDLLLHVDKIIPLETKYGEANMHVMSDEEGNEFIWTTSSRMLPINYYTLRGTVKDHRTYRGKNQTILTRCGQFKEARMWNHDVL